MPENLIFTENEAEFLRALVRQKVEFMIVGLSAANLQGAPCVTQDVDLWFKDLSDPALLDALRTVGGAYVPPIALNPPRFAGQNVALFDIVVRMDGLGSFDQEARSAVQISLGGVRVKVLPLERIIASKRAANRDQDKRSLPVLEDTLRTIRPRDIAEKRKRS